MKNNKKHLIIIIFLIIIFIIFGLWYKLFYSISNNDANIIDNVEKTNYFTDKEFFDLATSSNDNNLCNKISNSDFKKKCFQYISDNTILLKIIFDSTYNNCSQITTGNIKSNCFQYEKDYNIVLEGIEKIDIKICDKIETRQFKNDCIIQVQESQENMYMYNSFDIKRCEKVDNIEIKNICITNTNKYIYAYNNFFNEYDICSYLYKNNSDINECSKKIDNEMYEFFAIDNEDINLCKKIVNKKSREGCIDSFYDYSILTSLKNKKESCDAITNVNIKNTCNNNKIQVISCNQNNNGAFMKYKCYLNASIKL